MSSQSSQQAVETLPLVSVAITAFNSECWLARALDSVLDQRADFPIEIVIGDDCSSDRTAAIARAYRERYPHRVRVIERPRNIGIQRNYYETFEQCRGKYIAWLDADDVWTDSQKLRVQIEALDSDPTVSVCGHFVRWITAEGWVSRERYPSVGAGRYGMDEILRHNILPSPSVVFRNGLHRELPAWYFDLAPTTDWPLWVLAAKKGDILLLDRIMADYVLTPGSSLMGQGALKWYKTDARFYEHIQQVLPEQWHPLVRAEKAKRYDALAYEYKQQSDFRASRRTAIKAIQAGGLTGPSGNRIRALASAIVRGVQSPLQHQGGGNYRKSGDDVSRRHNTQVDASPRSGDLG